jgi:hypothetical protein
MITHRQVIIVFTAFLLMGGFAPLAAKTLTFDQQKCHIDVPDDWTENPTAGNAATYVNADQTKSIVLRIVATGTDLTFEDPTFLEGAKKSMVANGATLTGQQTITFCGLDARTIDTTQNAPAGKVFGRMTIVFADGNAYALYVAKLAGNPWEDDQLNGIVSSFGFIGAPVIHHQGLSRSDLISQLVGEVVGFFVALLAIICIIKWIRKKRPAVPPGPPPPPFHPTN